MNAVVTACASSDRTGAWHRIDWAACHQNVRRLQARIVKATEAGRWGKVHALQWLLTHAWSGKALAVKRVTENTGKNTPGVDKVSGRPRKPSRWRGVVAEARVYPSTSSKSLYP